MTKVLVKKMHSVRGHTDSIYALARGLTDNLFFSAGGDGMIVLWDLNKPEKGELIARLPNSIYALYYLKAANLLVAGHNYEGIHILDLNAKKEVHSMKLGTAAIFDIKAFRDDLFVSLGDGSVIVIDMNNWSTKKIIKHSEKSARALAVNPVKGELAVAYSDHHIRIYELENYSLKYEWVAHQNSVFTIAFDPDYKTLISGSRDARLKSWDAGAIYGMKQEVVAHLYAINNVVFSQNGKHFVTCSLDKSIKVWDAAEVKLLKVIDKGRHAGHGTSVNKLIWTSFNDLLISASDDRTISVWELEFYMD